MRKLALRTSFIARTRKCTSKRAVSKAKANSNTSADLIQLGRRRRARRPNWLCGVACLNAALAESLFQRASRAPCSKLWLHFQPADYSRLAVGSLDGASKKLATAGCCRRCRCRCCCVLTHSEQEREREPAQSPSAGFSDTTWGRFIVMQALELLPARLPVRNQCQYESALENERERGIRIGIGKLKRKCQLQLASNAPNDPSFSANPATLS